MRRFSGAAQVPHDQLRRAKHPPVATRQDQARFSVGTVRHQEGHLRCVGRASRWPVVRETHPTRNFCRQSFGTKGVSKQEFGTQKQLRSVPVTKYAINTTQFVEMEAISHIHRPAVSQINEPPLMQVYHIARSPYGHCDPVPIQIALCVGYID